MTWYYNDVPLTEDMIEADWIGFVYLIENLLTGRKYLGKKGFFRSKIYQKNNRKRRKTVQSDWQKYYGSSEELKEEIRNNGKENFKRTILHICKSKSEMNYLELREQMVRDVLLKPNEYINAFVGTRINRNQLKRIFK